MDFLLCVSLHHFTPWSLSLSHAPLQKPAPSSIFHLIALCFFFLLCEAFATDETVQSDRDGCLGLAHAVGLSKVGAADVSAGKLVIMSKIGFSISLI